jgi:hypothetical protein
MSEHDPHPLVVALAGGLLGDEASQAAERLVARWPNAQWGSGGGASDRTQVPEDQESEQGQKGEQDQGGEQSQTKKWTNPSDLADEFVRNSTLANLITFSGYVGGKLNLKDRGTWQYFYLDRVLRSWILIEAKNIVRASRVRDDKQPFRCGRDTIWLKSFEPVISGDTKLTSDDISGRIYRREFTVAANVTGSVSGSEPPTGSGAFYPGRGT